MSSNFIFFGKLQPTLCKITFEAWHPILQQSYTEFPLIYSDKNPPKKASPAPFKSTISSFFNFFWKNL